MSMSNQDRSGGGESFDISFGGSSTQRTARPPPRLSSSRATPVRAQSPQPTSSGGGFGRPRSTAMTLEDAKPKSSPGAATPPTTSLIVGKQFEIGERVKVKRVGASQYDTGTILGKNATLGTYEVKFSDGKIDPKVPKTRIAKLEAGAGAGDDDDRGGESKSSSSSAAKDALMGGSGDESAVTFKIFDNVEAHRENGIEWLPARISNVNKDGTFDIRFTGGFTQSKVPARHVRKPGGGSGGSGFGGEESKSTSRGEESKSAGGSGNRTGTKSLEGKKVEANYKGKGKWYKGSISRDWGDGSFDVAYDDGESERRVPEDMIRLLDAAPAPGKSVLEVGVKVEANYGGKGKWFKGKIARERPDGTFDVTYDDGDSEARVPEDRIRVQSQESGDHRSASVPRLSEGTKVETNYKGKGKWYKGKISRERSDGTYDIAYDDGEAETHVEKDMIRVLDAPTASSNSRSKSQQLEEGSKVEANYGGKGKWFKGVVSRVRSDGTFDIKYNDGDSEQRVSAELIRLLDDDNSGAGGGAGGKAAILVEGMKVEANFKGKGRYYKGKIARERSDGTFDIAYDDGESELRVERSMIRPIEDDVGTSNSKARLEEGAKVEANYKGKGKWYKGKISRQRANGTFDVAYDDGESEASVPSDMIRLLGGDDVRVSASKVKLQEGLRVEANFKGKGRWYKGKISRERSDGTFDVAYDDGESEQRVERDMIRIVDDGSGAGGSGGASKAVLQEGAKVEANYKGKGKWYKGKISRERSDGTFDIAYDDGESELRVPPNMIRLLSDGGAPPRLAEGAKVEANYKGKGKFFKGRITRERANGTFDIVYDDGETELGVPSDMIRSLDGGDGVRGSGTKVKLQEGSRVEANYKGKGKFYKGKITRERANGTFDIAYDDGETELGIPADMIRTLEDGDGVGRASGNKSKLQEGSRVEANYKGKGKFYKGKITRERANGTFDIAYDDGETELGVPADMIRLQDAGGDGDIRSSKPRMRLEEGVRVEGNYKGKGKYYKGKITRVRANGTFDITYDDGESELGVSEDMIRVQDAGGDTDIRSSKQRTRLEEGVKVEANYKGKGKYYKGKITRVRANGTFDITYDDGESEMAVAEEMIRVQDAGDDIKSSGGGRARLQEGAKVEANYKGKGKWFKGKITRECADGSFNITYDDGESEMRVPAEMIRLLEQDPSDGVRISGSRPARFEEGMKIEANFKGRGRWYKGKIARERANGTFDVAYDDGETETGVSAEMLRALEDDSSVRSQRLEEGAKVEGNYKGKGKWFKGKITRQRANGTFDIAYDDGESELGVQPEMIRLQSSGASLKLEEGMKVEANFKGNGRWFKGKISRERADGTFDIAYDDGESELRVPADRIRALDGGDRNSGGSGRAKLQEGSKVEANFGGKGKWFKGKISRERPDGTFDITYDDGDAESRVPVERIRLLESSEASSPTRKKVRITEGSKVEANYRGRGKWYKGRVSRERADGTFDITYDDGESEAAVLPELVRLQEAEDDEGKTDNGGGKGILREGMKVEANYKGKGKWYKGKISRERGDDTFDIAYDDGESELRVAANMIRSVEVDDHANVRTSGSKLQRLEVGMKVEVNYKGKGKFYKGKISRERPNGTYDISYDDGEAEMGVSADMIRSLDGGGGPGRAKLEEGMKIEANFKGKGRWYKGKIHRDRGDGTYDVYYDDGESEMRVSEDMIRLLDDREAGGRSSSPSKKPRIMEGSKVEGNHRGRGKWYKGKVINERSDGTFDIKYDDGETETRVEATMIRLLDGDEHSDSKRVSRLEEGARVEANYKGKGKWYKGKISRERANGTFDIAYDDGESESSVPADMIRSLDVEGGSTSPVKRGSRISEGSKVEANYRGRGKWYKGKVTNERSDGTFDIAYDDGETESRVPADMIRVLDTDDAKTTRKSHLVEGTKVEVNYKGKGKWYKGKISRERANGTYDIAYDDGESETGVEAEMIRSLDADTSSSASRVRLEEGAKVEANYKGKGKWYKGKISRERADNTFDITYDDGESELRVPADMIRLIDSNGTKKPRLEEGSKVEANYKGKGKWYPGKISRDRGDGTFDIAYADGEAEMRVPDDMIRLLDAVDRESHSSPIRKKIRITEGSKVEGNYRGRGKWYKGKVTNERSDGTFDITYVDGESETRVPPDMIRLLDDDDSGSASERKVKVKLQEGMKVEADYKGKGKWYKGKISRERADGTFDITYDDGENELRVPADMIRSLEDGKSVSKKPRLEEGLKVEANHKGKGKWYTGKISRERADGTFDIAYDDGESELRVPEDMIRLLESSSNSKAKLQEGAKVEANYKGKGKWYKGKISRERADDTFDIAYDDGESEMRVPADMIRLLDGGTTSSGGRKSARRLEEGDKIEANYKDKGKWYPGKISRDRGDGTFDIAYADGETELRVQEDMIRHVDGDNGASSNSRSRLEEGARVEANYRGKGKWFSGIIARDRRDGTFDIAYDDGESESRVPEDLIRLLDKDGGKRQKLEEGSKVEGNYKGNGKWYPGKISRERADGTFDIAYDDGESEMRVHESMIRPLDRRDEDSSLSRSNRGSGLEEGTKVEANYRGRGKWYTGKISRVNSDGTFDISYDDGESEKRVPESLIRAIEKSGKSSSRRPQFSEGDKVEANYKRRGKWYPGKISRERSDGTFDIDYDDGEAETRVEEENIRPLEKSSSAGGGRKRSGFHEGDKVEGNYRGKGKWYKGKITRERPDGTFDVEYDDGESESRLSEDLLRLLDDDRDDLISKLKSPSKRKSRIEEGMRVEANYQDRGRWLPGKVVKERDNGTFDIDYDDGKSETRVQQDLIKSLDDSDDDASARTRKLLLPKEAVTAVRKLIAQFQKKSDDTTAFKLMEGLDETNPTGLLSKREFKSALKSIFTKVHQRDSFDDWCSEAHVDTLIEALVASAAAVGGHNSSRGGVNYADFLLFASETSKESEELIDFHTLAQKEVIKKEKRRMRDVVRLFADCRSFKTAGYVNKTEFERILKSKLMPKSMGRSALEACLNKFDPADEGVIDVHLFVAWLYLGGGGPGECAAKVIAQLQLLKESDVSNALADAASRGSGTKLNLNDLNEALLSTLGLAVSRADIRMLLTKLDPETSGYVAVDTVVDSMALKKKGKGGRRDDDVDDNDDGPGGGKKNKKFGTELISRGVRDDIADAVKAFLSASANNFVGKVVGEHCEERATTSSSSDTLPVMSKRQFRKATEQLGCQIDDLDTLLYEFLDLQGASQASVFDLILYCYDLANEGDSLEAARAFRDAFVKNAGNSKGAGGGTAVKEFYRALVKNDVAKTGMCDQKFFEKTLTRLCGSKLHPDVITDIERFLDPNKEGRFDIRFAAAMAYASTDENRAIAKVRHMFRLLRSRDVDYQAELRAALGVQSVAATAAEDKNKEEQIVKTDDVVNELRNLFQPPMLLAELHLVVSKYERRGKLNLNYMFEQLETGAKDDPQQAVSKGHNEEFSKNLFKKLCKIRASADKREQFRSGILSMDSNMRGYIARRDMQRVCDRHLDLTEPEAALLMENLGCVDGSHRNELEYSLLLLILYEPISRSPIVPGTTLILKMMRGSDSVNLRRLLALLFSNCADADSHATGLVPYESAQRVLVDECTGIDIKIIIDVMNGFKDSGSNCVLYPELLAFLSCCSLWSVMYRIHHLDLIRQKQGYKFQDFIVAYAKKGKSIDIGKLSDQLLAIGMLIPVTAVNTIWNAFSKAGKGLDAAQFAAAISSANDDNNDGSSSSTGLGRVGKGKGNVELAVFQSGTDDKVVTQILKEYDERVTRAVAAAFDLYDPAATNLVPAPELERILCSLGYPPNYNDLQTLWMQTCILDGEGKQQLEYHKYMEHVVAHLRGLYSSFHVVSLDKLHALFTALDINKDGTLNRHEFRHVVKSIGTHQPATALTEEEFEALVQYLDVDGDGVISWDEFKLTFQCMKDDALMYQVPGVVAVAMKKMHYSCLPDPEKYLTMFNGLPFTYRPSVLAEVDKVKRFGIATMVCVDPNLPQQQVPEADDVMFEVNIEHVSGIPVEHSSRTCDLLHKGIRFAICRTDNPPTEDASGTRPEFLSNVVKLHATEHAKYKDKLVFTNAGDRDPSASCFIRCNNNSKLLPKRFSHADLPQERLSNVRDAQNQKARNPALPMLTPVAEEEDANNSNDPNKKKSGNNAASNIAATAAANRGGTMQLYLFVEMVCSFRLPVFDESEDEMRERAESRKDRNQQLMKQARTPQQQQQQQQQQGQQAAAGAGAGGGMFGWLSRTNASTTASTNASLSVNTNNNNNNENNDSNSPHTRSPGKGKKSKRKGGAAADYSNETVEMCAGWAMIPISELIAILPGGASAGAPMSKPFTMHGGTPFMNVNIRDKDIVQRQGTWQQLKRGMGYTVKPKLSVLVTPPITSTPAASVSGAARVNSMRVSNSTAAALLSPAKPVDPNAALAATKPPDPNQRILVADDTTKLLSLLPPQVVLPTNGVTLVCIYRAMLRDTLRLTLDAPDRILPQRGSVTVQQDVILGSFPKILSDPATCSVLMKLWAKDAPDTITSKRLGTLTVADINNRRVLDAFHDVVLRVYRTLHCLEAQKDRFNPFESLADLYKREELIRKLCGISPHPAGTTAAAGGAAGAGGAGAPGTPNPNAAAAADADYINVTYAPFNARELHFHRSGSRGL